MILMHNNANSSKIIYPDYLPMLIIALITAMISACVLSPIYTQISSDVVLMYTVLPIIVDYLIIIFDMVYISILFAVISCSTYNHFKNEENKHLGLMLACTVVCLKHILNLTVSSIIDSYIDVTFDIPLTLILILLDAASLMIVKAISVKRCKKHFNHAKRMQKAAKYLENVVYDENTDIFPFGSLLNTKNPIIFPIFVGVIITLAVLILQRLYADFVMIGLPASFYEVVEIVISYLSDILLGVIGYIAAYYAAVYVFIKKSN